MKYKIILFLMCFSIVGCQKDDEVLDVGIVSNEVSYTKISELPEVPSFANPIRQNEEVREFGLLTDNGEKLLFKLVPNKSKIFGEQRILLGTVQVHEKKDKAAMIVGEDGFEILFSKNQESFRIKKYNNIDVGYENPLHSDQAKKLMNTISFKQELKNVFKSAGLTYDQSRIDKLFHDSRTLSSKLKKSRKTNYICSKIELKKNNTGHCGAKEVSKGSFSNTKTQSKNVEENFPIIDTVFVEEGFEITEHLLAMFFNFITVFPNPGADGTSLEFLLGRSVQFTNTIAPVILEEITSGQGLTVFTDYILSVAKSDDSGNQLDRLRDFSDRHLSHIKSTAMYASFYNKGWDDRVIGLAFVNEWNLRNIRNVSHAVFVTSDSGQGVTSHEWSHVMGASHTTNGDVMNATENGALDHRDAGNIQRIRNSVGL